MPMKFGTSWARRPLRLGPEWPQSTTWTESTCEFLGVTTAFVLLFLLGSFCSAIETQARILFKLKEHIKAEIGMHAAAGENHDSLTRMLLFFVTFSLCSRFSTGLEGGRVHGEEPGAGQGQARHGHRGPEGQGEAAHATRKYVFLFCVCWLVSVQFLSFVTAPFQGS